MFLILFCRKEKYIFGVADNFVFNCTAGYGVAMRGIIGSNPSLGTVPSGQVAGSQTMFGCSDGRLWVAKDSSSINDSTGNCYTRTALPAADRKCKTISPGYSKCGR